jgi:type II secretory pathway component PulF
MPLFDYAGQLQSGWAFQGTLEAESREHAESILADMGVRVISLRPARRTAYVAPLSLDDFLFFNEQVAAMVKAEIPLEEGLRQLAADVGSRKLKRLLIDLADDLQAGTTLEEALAKQQRRFPTQYTGVVQAGLKTGDLGGVLHSLATHLELKSTARRALLELAAYPVVILLFAFVVLSLLMRVVVPQVEAMITDMVGARHWWGTTPASGRAALSFVVFRASHVWPYIELAVIAFVAAICLFLLATCLPGGRRVREWLLRHIPGIAQVYWSSVLARFTHTAALGAFSGTPLPELMTASGAASGSRSLARTSHRVADRLQNGEALQDAARDERDLPALWSFVVAVASGRGDLPLALEELARTYEARAQRWISTLRVLLGPILLIFVGIVLGWTIAGMMLAFTSVIRALTA